MAKGRKPIPTKLKQLRGTAQPCRINKDEIKTDKLSKLPPAPRWFSKTQRKIYKTKGEQLRNIGILSPLDMEMFISFCREYGNYIDTSTELEKIPLMVSLNEKSEQMFRRLNKINRESWERSKTLAAEFGFTPSARAKISVDETKDNEDYDFD